jgi:hypothetical protein
MNDRTRFKILGSKWTASTTLIYQLFRTSS